MTLGYVWYRGLLIAALIVGRIHEGYSASEEYSGFVGCLFSDNVCNADEFCIDESGSSYVHGQDENAGTPAAGVSTMAASSRSSLATESKHADMDFNDVDLWTEVIDNLIKEQGGMNRSLDLQSSSRTEVKSTETSESNILSRPYPAFSPISDVSDEDEDSNLSPGSIKICTKEVQEAKSANATPSEMDCSAEDSLSDQKHAYTCITDVNDVHLSGKVLDTLIKEQDVRNRSLDLQSSSRTEDESTETSESISLSRPYPAFSPISDASDEDSNLSPSSIEISTKEVFQEAKSENATPSEMNCSTEDSPSLSNIHCDQTKPFKENKFVGKSTKYKASMKLHSKPDLTNVQMIAKAILSSPNKRLLLSEIYEYYMNSYPYYMNLPGNHKTRLRNTIRHTLSDSCIFRNGSHYWEIHEACIEDFKVGICDTKTAKRKVKAYEEEKENLCQAMIASMRPPTNPEPFPIPHMPLIGLPYHINQMTMDKSTVEQKALGDLDIEHESFFSDLKSFAESELQKCMDSTMGNGNLSIGSFDYNGNNPTLPNGLTSSIADHITNDSGFLSAGKSPYSSFDAISNAIPSFGNQGSSICPSITQQSRGNFTNPISPQTAPQDTMHWR